MITLLPIILFVTTDIYEKRKMFLIANVIKMLLPLQIYADNKHFPKNSSFFHNFI
jgi:uncharacterized membrane protein YGL010W